MLSGVERWRDKIVLTVKRESTWWNNTLQHQPVLNPTSASFFSHSHLLPAVTPVFPPFTTTKFTRSPVNLFLMINLVVFEPEHPFLSHQTVWCFTSEIASYFLCLQVLTCYKPQPDFFGLLPSQLCSFWICWPVCFWLLPACDIKYTWTFILPLRLWV